MSTARHPRPPEVENLPLEEIAARHVLRFRDRKADWAAFEDAKIEGFIVRSRAVRIGLSSMCRPLLFC